MSPAASALAREVPFSIHLDTPVVPMDPLFLVWTAVNRLSSSGQVIGEAERIDTMEALKAVMAEDDPPDLRKVIRAYVSSFLSQVLSSKDTQNFLKLVTQEMSEM